MNEATDEVIVPLGEARLVVSQSALVRAFLEKMSGTAQTNATLEEGRPAIGEYWKGQGGIYVGDMIGENGKPQYSLIVPMATIARVEAMAYGGRGSDEPGANSAYDGLANTLALFNSKTEHPIAKWVRGLTIEGHNDFYIFARNEARLCHINGPGLFNVNGWYWTSTQNAGDPDWAWIQYFNVGNQNTNFKDNRYRVCALRRVSHSVIR